MERSVRQRTRVLGLLLIFFALPPAEFAQREGRAHAQKELIPGETWLDTRGKPINAHGGGMFYQTIACHFATQQAAHPLQFRPRILTIAVGRLLSHSSRHRAYASPIFFVLESVGISDSRV